MHREISRIKIERDDHMTVIRCGNFSTRHSQEVRVTTAENEDRQFPMTTSQPSGDGIIFCVLMRIRRFLPSAAAAYYSINNSHLSDENVRMPTSGSMHMTAGRMHI